MADPALAFEHKILRSLNRVGPSPARWLVAVSGGLDSMVLAEVLWRWRRKLKVELAVAHFHHGRSDSFKQNRFRNRAQGQVARWCKDHSVHLYTAPPVGFAPASEAELRKQRLKQLREWFLIGGFDRIVFAHHADDLLETRLLRLIRGSGRQGLKAMAAKRGRILRPLLAVTRREIENYAEIRRLSWIEDPSNKSSDSSLRNWLRQEWLPQLEHRMRGASSNMARSLGQMATDDFTETIGPFVGLRRAALEALTDARRESLVARYLRTMGLSGYSRHHVQELLKRLESQAQVTRFEMLGLEFHATPDFLWASDHRRV